MILTRRALITGSLAATLGGPILAQSPSDPRPTDSERAAMAQAAASFMATYDVPGLSIAYTVGGRPAHAQAFGLADPARGERLTPGHRFRIASLTKPFTSVAVLQLVEVGALTLSTPVLGPGGILGGTYRVRPDRPELTRITVEHLLTHTAGGWSNSAHDPMFMFPAMSQPDLIQWTLDNAPLTDEPGSRYAYSNFGYCLLGRVIEAVARQPYDAVVRQNVAGRCGIGDMQIAGNTRSQRAPGEVVYVDRDRDPYDLNIRRMDSHGGWIATAGDLSHFMASIDGTAGSAPLLSPQMFRIMRTPSVVGPGYAKGLMVTPQGVVYHNGSLPGSMTIMARPRNDICWAGVTNTRSSRPGMGIALDRLMWTMARQVPAWRV